MNPNPITTGYIVFYDNEHFCGW